MADFKEGFGSKPTHIKVSANAGDRKAHIYTEEEALPKMDGIVSERLTYATIEELLDLRNEINQALKTLVGVE